MTTEVWFIRHGQSEANAGLATHNPNEIALTPTGHEQARRVSAAFERAPDLIVTSKYRRAIETANETVARFPSVPVETWDMHEFSYLGLLGPTTMQDRMPLVRAYWDRFNPNYIDGEGAESFANFIERVKAMQDKVRQMDGKFIAIFGHGFVMKALLWANMIGSFEVTDEYMRRFYAYNRTFEVANGAIVKAEYRPESVLLSGLLTNHLS